MTNESKQDFPPRTVADMALYQCVTGATRTRLDEGWCGYQIGAEQIRCFVDHDRFFDEQLWAQHCPGPRYSCDTDAMREVEQLLVERGHIRRYVRILLPNVYPNWDDVQLEVEVFDFWMALLTAPPSLRARAALHVLGGRSDTGNRVPRRREITEGNALLGELRTATRTLLKACARAQRLSSGAVNTPLQRRLILEILDNFEMPMLWSLSAVLQYGQGKFGEFTTAELTIRQGKTQRATILEWFTDDQDLPQHLDRAWKGIAVTFNQPELGPMGLAGEQGSDQADEEIDRKWYEGDDDEGDEDDENTQDVDQSHDDDDDQA